MEPVNVVPYSLRSNRRQSNSNASMVAAEPSRRDPEPRHARAVGAVRVAEAAGEVLLLGGDDATVGEGEAGNTDQVRRRRVVNDQEPEQRDQVAEVERIAAVREHSVGHQIVGVDAPILAAAADVGEPDHQRAQRLTGDRELDAHQVERAVPAAAGRRATAPAWSPAERRRAPGSRASRARNTSVPTDPGRSAPRHFTAIIPQKLYHLKNTSTCRKPGARSSSLFSSSAVRHQHVLERLALLRDLELAVAVAALHLVVVA